MIKVKEKRIIIHDYTGDYEQFAKTFEDIEKMEKWKNHLKTKISKIFNKQVDVELVYEVVNAIEIKPNAFGIEELLEEIETLFDVSMILRKSNSPTYTLPRIAFVWICYHNVGFTIKEIQNITSIRNHSNIHYYLDKFPKEYEMNKVFREKVKKISRFNIHRRASDI